MSNPIYKSLETVFSSDSKNNNKTNKQQSYEIMTKYTGDK